MREACMCRVNGDANERFKLNNASTGKGPAVRVETGENKTTQAKMNHITSIKSQHVASWGHDPTWLLNMQAGAPQMYGRLAANAIKSNAVNSSVTKREKTQGAANQTSRINCKAIGQAAAAQASAVAVTMAIARDRARKLGSVVANPMATNSANPCSLWAATVGAEVRDTLFPLTVTSHLVFNAMPTKLGAGCVLTEAKKLARAELDAYAISETMGSSNHMLEGICKAIVSPGEYQLDAVWATWVLVVYLCCHPMGRVLLRGTSLTDLDYQTATAFESYGRAEITRRARLEAQQRHFRKRKAPAAESSGLQDEGREEAQSVASTEEATASPHGVLAQMAEEERRTLATKRKRGIKGCASASTSDSFGMLQWWYGALRCDNNSVLMSLIAHSKQAARDAANQTLQKQAEGVPTVAENTTIRVISEENAVSSAQALVPFVGRRAKDIPALATWKWNGAVYCGITRTQEEARTTTLHACRLAPATVQPKDATKMALSWSMASMQYAPRSDDFTTVPCILERLQDATTTADRSKRGELVAARVAGMVLREAEPPRPVAMSGVTRSTISVSIRLTVNNSQTAIGEELGERLHEMTAGEPGQGGGNDGRGPVLLAVDQDASSRREPLCSPATRLALGIGVNEELRCWMMGKTRKNDPCKVLLGVATQQERSRDAPAIINAEPPPLLTIVDFQLECMDADDSCETTAADRRFGLALHVCGDGIVRVPEMLLALRAECGPTPQFVQQARATVWAAVSQASYISNVAPIISAGFANSAISSSKKISVADNHRLMLLTPFDVYATGMINLEPSYLNTPYAGTYGCPLDHGISPPGELPDCRIPRPTAPNRAQPRPTAPDRARLRPTAQATWRTTTAATSDSTVPPPRNLPRAPVRTHPLSECARTGNCTLSEQMADKLAPHFAEAHWVQFVDGEHYCESPVSTRGIPHNLTPGIHACLNEYVEALETLRKHTGRTDAPTVDSLTCLAFGPWSQALAPIVEATADLSMRLCVRDPSILSTGQSGAAYLPDSTTEEEAIVCEPLFRRPHQASVSDNPFCTSYEHMDSFFNLANAVVLMCRIGVLEVPICTNDMGNTAAGPTDAMVARIDAWVLGSTDGTRVQNAAVCADILLMLSVMYPQKHGIAEDIVLPAWAEAVPALHHKLEEQRLQGAQCPAGALFGDLGLNEALVAQGRAWWSAFTRSASGVWRHGALGELLRLLDDHNGSHDVSRAKYAEVRDVLKRSVEAAWLVASPDGVARPPKEHPAHDVGGTEHVKRPTVDPVFVGDKKRGVRQRGCLVGIKPHQLRQVCALAAGAHLAKVVCQVSRNEGARTPLKEHCGLYNSFTNNVGTCLNAQVASRCESAAPPTYWTIRATNAVPKAFRRYKQKVWPAPLASNQPRILKARGARACLRSRRASVWLSR